MPVFGEVLVKLDKVGQFGEEFRVFSFEIRFIKEFNRGGGDF